jgi:hypothetical protein
LSEKNSKNKLHPNLGFSQSPPPAHQTNQAENAFSAFHVRRTYSSGPEGKYPRAAECVKC